MPSSQHLTRTGRFQAEVTGLAMLSPRMRRIELSSAELAGHSWPLGCDIAIVLTGPDGREVRRRYTVRSARGETLTVDAVLHGHGPGSSWAAGLALGEQVGFFGPRGRLEVEDADWLLAVTDEAGLPAIGALTEALDGRPITVLAEIADDAEHYPLAGNADVRWIVRGDRPAGSPELVTEALAGLPLAAGRGYAYLLGESRAAVRWRDELTGLGLPRESIYAKGYWNLNARATR